MRTRSNEGHRGPTGPIIAVRLLVALTLLVATTATPTRAAVPMITYTASAQQVALGYPGDRLALPEGEQLRNQVQILKVESADVRLAGRRILLTQGLKKADGTSDLMGTWMGEPGTWLAGVFTPSGGVWDGSWRGTRQADGSLALTLTARGTGGSFDGLELKETMTRASGPDFDPTLRFDITGRTAPTHSWVHTVFEDDFEDGTLDPAWRPMPGGQPPAHTLPRLEERNGSMTLYLDPTDELRVPSMIGTITVGRTVALQDGQTLELSLDMAGVTGTTSHIHGVGLALLEAITPEFVRGYGSVAEPILASIVKYSGQGTELYPRFANGSYYRPGLTFILSVTRSDATTAILRFRVKDRTKNDRVVFDASWTDTTAADRVPVESDPDIEGPPWLSFIEAGFFLAFVPNTPQPPPKNLTLTIDNFSLRVFESSPYEFQIERAVLLTPPASAQPYVVEGAPSVTGPWTPLSTPEVQIHGVRHLLVPVSETPGSMLFRLK